MSEDLYQYQDNQPQDFNENENGGSEKIYFNQELNSTPINNRILSSRNTKSFHQIFSEEDNKTYDLKFSAIGNNLKILLSEQDNFPAKTYEVLLDLEELQLKNNLFTIYSSTKELSDILNKNENNINFNIKRKSVNILALTIIFPKSEDYTDNDIEIDLTENIIDDREMFRQLFEKYKSIQKEQNEDIEQFMNRIAKIEEILAPPEVKQETQNENENEQEEIKGEENCEEKEKINENVDEKKIEETKKIEDDKISEVKSSNKASKKSIQKGKNEKKGKFEKKDIKSKKIQKKKK